MSTRPEDARKGDGKSERETGKYARDLIGYLRMIRDCPKLNGSAKALLLAIALRASTEHGYTGAFGGHKRLAKDSGLAERTVSRLLTEVREMGFVKRTIVGSLSAGRSDRYALAWPSPAVLLAWLTEGADDDTMRTCDVDGCEGRHHAKGLCHAHYMDSWRPSKRPRDGTLGRHNEEGEGVRDGTLGRHNEEGEGVRDGQDGRSERTQKPFVTDTGAVCDGTLGRLTTPKTSTPKTSTPESTLSSSDSPPPVGPGGPPFVSESSSDAPEKDNQDPSCVCDFLDEGETCPAHPSGAGAALPSGRPAAAGDDDAPEKIAPEEEDPEEELTSEDQTSEESEEVDPTKEVEDPKEQEARNLLDYLDSMRETDVRKLMARLPYMREVRPESQMAQLIQRVEAKVKTYDDAQAKVRTRHDRDMSQERGRS